MAKEKGLCRQFSQTGKCDHGAHCRFRHEQSAADDKPKLCFAFQKGTCKRGAACKYSHDANGASNTTKANTSGEDSKPRSAQDEAFDAYKRWRFDIPHTERDIRRAKALHDLFPTFIQEALRLVEASTETMQQVIASLAEEGGAMRLGELLNADLATLDDGRLEVAFRERLLPLLQIVSHDSVLASTIAEARHATILTYMYGINGQRAVTIFRAATREVTRPDTLPDSVGPCIITLSAILQVNSSAPIHEDLRSVAETLVALAREYPFTGNARRHYQALKLRLGLGGEIGESKNGHQGQASFARPTFTVTADQPGELSSSGQRHDNDWQQIEDIQVLPTIGEIQSDRGEYLPRSDPTTWHKTGIAGLLDRHFRLVREDTVGQLRDAAKFELTRMQNPHAHTGPMRFAGARTYTYHNLRLTRVESDDMKGLLCMLEFSQPVEIRGKSPAQRREWWTESKRLEPESLVVLLGSDGLAIFVTVATLTPPPRPGAKHVQAEPIEKRFSRWQHPEIAYVVVQLVNVDDNDVESMLSRFGHGTSKSAARLTFNLLEFPGVLLPAFQPTLKALQHMSIKKDLPFAQILAPTEESSAVVELPAYAQREDFRFDLSPITTNQGRLHLYPKDPPAAEDVYANTTLDRAQAEAVIASLTRSLALIQGPPGTGKSFTGVALMKVLLENRAAANLGPVICVTFTNHALDQSLEHLVDAGLQQIIRIGSRSKSEKLAPLNLREVAQKYDPTKLEKHKRWKERKNMESSSRTVNDLLRRLFHAKSDANVMAYLRTSHPAWYEQLTGDEVDEEGFVKVDRHAPKGLKGWLKAGVRANPVDGEDTDLTDLTSLSHEQREQLYSGWIEELTAPIQKNILLELKAWGQAKAEFDQIRAEVDYRVLSQANVIGLTTSGLARNLGLLRRLNAKVLLVEEAGEVLEAHLLTAMLPSIEHAILIGDHQQLRPKVQNFDLSCENRSSQNKLDISLFERLVSPEYTTQAALPYTTLQTQRRMHPSISDLIRTTLYPQLQDYESVQTYPEVVGMRQRLFWLQHHQKEDGKRDQHDATSRTNQYEVDMVFALVRHLVRQGVYRADEIAVLTPYLGQLRKLRRALASFAEVVLNDRDTDELAQDGPEDEGGDQKTGKDLQAMLSRAPVAKSTLLQTLRLATVDNFQGEEAKVVIISLVRCNDERRCGFLRTSNRINVLLSRAQHGMYIIGNTETSAHVGMWGQILSMLEQGNRVGEHLELCCPRHPETPLRVQTPDDFTRVSPEAGCDLMCDKQLMCGHACVNKCHSNGMHNAVYCLKPCTRPKEGCDHTCPYECGHKCDDKCGQLIVRNDIVLPCGHRVTSLPCWQYQDLTKAICNVPVQRTIPGCEHKITLPCHEDGTGPDYKCTAHCGTPQDCGHICKKPCHQCKSRADGKVTTERHGRCIQPCGRDYTNCKHACKAACHGDEPCPLCSQPCDSQCSHSRCMKACHEPCAPLAEEACASQCPHSACAMPCAAPCDWVPCSERCHKLLSCGHQCPSICGTPCASERFCQACAPDEVKELRADLLMMLSYAEVDLAESPCIVTPCGHVFTVESLDGVMSMSDHYNVDPTTGMPLSNRGSSEPFSYKEMKVCPDCRGSLRSMPRYGRIVRRALLDESTKKFIAWSNSKYIELAEQLQRELEELRENRDNAKFPAADQVVGLSPLPPTRALKGIKGMGARYRRISTLHTSIDDFLQKVVKDEQPFKRVRDMVETIRRRRLEDNEEGIGKFDFDQEVLQTRGQLLASSLVIRCDITAISDFVALWNEGQNGPSKTGLYLQLSTSRQDCERLIAAAKQTLNLLQQAEGQIYWAHLAALECNVMENRVDGEADAMLQELKAAAERRLDDAQGLCEQYPNQTKTIAHEIPEVRRMLRENSYESQMKMVVAAMATEFSGTGHWYRCVNGHPFTVGECGMPMQRARCPQCDAPIGGQNHQAAEGVQHAGDIERQFGNMRL